LGLVTFVVCALVKIYANFIDGNSEYIVVDSLFQSTLADNLNGAKILGRIVRVDHVSNYKKKEEEEDDEKEKQKREERGVCRAFQRGDCTRGASCRFSHDEHVSDCQCLL